MVAITAVVFLTALLVVGVPSRGDVPPKYCGRDFIQAVVDVCGVRTPKTKKTFTPEEIRNGGIKDTCCRTGCTDKQIRASGICNIDTGSFGRDEL